MVSQLQHAKTIAALALVVVAPVILKKPTHVESVHITRGNNMKNFLKELEILISCGAIAYILLRIVESL